MFGNFGLSKTQCDTKIWNLILPKPEKSQYAFWIVLIQYKSKSWNYYNSCRYSWMLSI